MTERYAEGENYTIDIVDGTAECRVWRRPDTDSKAGARFAQKKIAVFQRLAREPVRGLLFDLREAPTVTGPKTQKAIESMLLPWKRASKPVAILVGPSHLQSLQIQRLTGPSDQCALFHCANEARTWLWENTGSGEE